MKNNFLPKMGPRGTGLAQSRGVWAMQQEFQGRVTENVRGKCQRQTAASGCCTLDLFTQCLIKLHHEGIQRPESSVSQTSCTKPLMYRADSSASQCLTLTWCWFINIIIATLYKREKWECSESCIPSPIYDHQCTCCVIIALLLTINFLYFF